MADPDDPTPKATPPKTPAKAAPKAKRARKTPPKAPVPPAAAADVDKTQISGIFADLAASDTPPEPVKPKLSVEIGTLINNNYRVQELISAGGMGEVFRGENAFTGDLVAIKIILQSLARDEKVVTLFKREARILCQLSDEAIVRYHNFIHDPVLDRYCLIMEYIDGIPLSDHVRANGPLSLDQARKLLLRLSDGLDKAHQREVTHRDLSPDNVMLRNGDVAQAVLIDFGIAKSTELSEGTLHGQFAGKFKYISPEQLGHFDGEITPRTDIYGLGLLIAMVVRGQPLEMGTSIVEAVNARRSIPHLGGIYPELRPLLAHMLEPDPTDRPAHMRDVARMVATPALIPAKYASQAAVGADRTVISGAVPGLQHPPGTIIAQIGSMTGAAAAETSESPFGGGSAAPFSQLTAPPLTAPPAAPKAKTNTTLIASVAAAVLLAAVGGWYVLRSGPAPIPDVVQADPQVQTTTPPDPQMPPPDTATREGFLAGFDAGDCSYATRATVGPNAGKIEGFAKETGRFSSLPAAYGTAFGAEPAIVERVVSLEQCAALDLLRGLQGRSAIEPILGLDTDKVQSGGTVVGRVSQARGRTVWLFLVSAKGGVYNLSPRLEPQADGSFTFSFGMSGAAGGDPAPQMIVALASDAPLVTAAAAIDGADATQLLPLVLTEIAGRDGKAAASVGYFQLTGSAKCRLSANLKRQQGNPCVAAKFDAQGGKEVFGQRSCQIRYRGRAARCRDGEQKLARVTGCALTVHRNIKFGTARDKVGKPPQILHHAVVVHQQQRGIGPGNIVDAADQAFAAVQLRGGHAQGDVERRIGRVFAREIQGCTLPGVNQNGLLIHRNIGVVQSRLRRNQGWCDPDQRSG